MAVYRRTFLNCTKTVIRVLHLPSNTFTFYGLIYLFSGLLHALGQISNDPPPQFSGVILFFLLAGLGNALEVMFKRVTGRFVGGPAGWVWTFFWSTLTGESGVNTGANAQVRSSSTLGLTPDGLRAASSQTRDSANSSSPTSSSTDSRLSRFMELGRRSPRLWSQSPSLQRHS